MAIRAGPEPQAGAGATWPISGQPGSCLISREASATRVRRSPASGRASTPSRLARSRSVCGIGSSGEPGFGWVLAEVVSLLLLWRICGADSLSEDHFDAEDMSSPDPAARLRKHVQDRLHVLERNGQCPVCNTTQWMLLNWNDVTLQATTTQPSKWPTYALACGNCGLVRHHLRSIFDGSEKLSFPGGSDSRVGFGDGGRGDRALEAKVAVLEKIAASTDDLLAELRWDLKAVRGKQDEDYRSLADRISGGAEGLSEKVASSALRICIAGGLAVAGVVGVMAKGFRWF